MAGTGLIGSSVGAALRRAGWTVRGTDIDRASARAAVRLGHIDSICSELRDCVHNVDAVILAAPVPAIITVLPEADRLAPGEALIMDTGSVKEPVVAAMQRLPGARRAIGGHPVAGSHHGGPESADPDLFRGRPFLLCPSSVTSSRITSLAVSLVTDLGGVPTVLSAAEHDRELAATSHLPQVLSTLLALQPADRMLSGTGYRDMTRLAASDPTLWRDILLLNRGNILDTLSSFRSSLDAFAEALKNEDAVSLEELLARGREGVAA